MGNAAETDPPAPSIGASSSRSRVRRGPVMASSIFPIHSETEDLGVFEVRCEEVEVVVQAVVEAEARAAVEPDRGVRQKTALVKFLLVKERILHADAAVVKA